MLVYGLDFWEHSIGLALMLWATVFFLKAREAPPAPAFALALVSGSLFGAAATMRQEALIYGAVTGLVCVFGPSAGPVVQRLLSGGAMAVGALVPMAANAMLEQAVIGSSVRTDRAVGVVSGVRNGSWSADPRGHRHHREPDQSCTSAFARDGWSCGGWGRVDRPRSSAQR